MSKAKPVVAEHTVAPGTTRSYIIGFGLSLVFTLGAYLCAVHKFATGWTLMLLLAALALCQLLVQLIFFLHLAEERRPRWNLNVALFAIMVVVIIVFGSLWIMKHLEYAHHHIAPANETDQSILKEEGYQQ